MRYPALMVLTTLVAFAVASGVSSVVIALFWRRTLPGLAGLVAVSRARVLVLIRILPVATGGLASTVTALAFLRHEPPSTAEVPGAILLTAAGSCAALFLAGLFRVLRRGWRTHRFLRTIESTATPVVIPGIALPTWQVELPFPLVALAGLWRSRLLVARQVREAIPADEFEIVLKHEIAHARRHDNVARLLVTGLPDLLGLAEGRLGIERAWHQALEDAADDLATAGDPGSRARLASALIRVAKMVTPQGPARIPLLAFHGGESIERRVRRLIDETTPASGFPSAANRFALVVLLTGAVTLHAAWDGLLQGVHVMTEWLVNARL
jgi:hypothetical protein